MGKTSRPPPGYRFHPTDVELVVYYLKRKVMRERFRSKEIAEVNIYKFAPWELPDKSISRSSDLKWYFFCPVEKKYSSGLRLNRATEVGCWKTTGKYKHVHHNKELVGSRKTLVFYRQRAQKRERTDWVMHEYRLEDKNLNTYVLCKIFQKEGLGPKNGAQYGAPFKEEEWNDEEADCAEDVPFPGSSTLTVVLPNNNSSSAAIGTTFLGGTISESRSSVTVPSQCERVSAVLNNNDVSNELYQVSGDILPAVLADNDDEIRSMFASLTEDNTLILNEDDKNKNLGRDEIAEEESDIYKDLGDLDHAAGPSEAGYDFYNGQGASIPLEDCFNITDLDQPLDS